MSSRTNPTGDTQSFAETAKQIVTNSALSGMAVQAGHIREQTHVNNQRAHYDELLAAHTAALRAELEALEIYTDPSHQKMSPFVRLKHADDAIRLRISALTNPQEGR